MMQLRSSFSLFALFAMILTSTMNANAQDARALSTNLHVSGVVVEVTKGKPLKDARVMLKSNGKTMKTITIDKKGNWEFTLPYGKIHEIVVEADGYVSQNFFVNAKDLDNLDKQYDYDYSGISFRMFEPVEGVDYSMYAKPIAKIAFDKAAEGFVKDELYDKEFRLAYDELRENLRKAR